jgi:hypothetical protein
MDDFQVIIKLRQGDCGDHSRDPDPSRDVFSVWIKGHRICEPGCAYRVGYTGEKVLNDKGEQIRGNMCWLFDTSGEYEGPSKMLSKPELKKILDYVSAWQQDAEAMEASRNDCEKVL